MTEVEGEIGSMTAELHWKSTILTSSESNSSLWAACCLSRRFVSWEQIWAEERASTSLSITTFFINISFMKPTAFPNSTQSHFHVSDSKHWCSVPVCSLQWYPTTFWPPAQPSPALCETLPSTMRREEILHSSTAAITLNLYWLWGHNLTIRASSSFPLFSSSVACSWRLVCRRSLVSSSTLSSAWNLILYVWMKE